MTTVTTGGAIDGTPILAPDDERPALAHIDRALAQCATASLVLHLPSGEEVAVPAAAARALQQAVHALAQGRAVTLVAIHKELTTQEAADILNVSRPYLVQLLEAGEIPHHKVGTHRRVDLDDLLAYRDRWDEARDKALRELTQMSEDFGLYDLPAAGVTKTR